MQEIIYTIWKAGCLTWFHVRQLKDLLTNSQKSLYPRKVKFVLSKQFSSFTGSRTWTYKAEARNLNPVCLPISPCPPSRLLSSHNSISLLCIALLCHVTFSFWKHYIHHLLINLINLPLIWYKIDFSKWCIRYIYITKWCKWCTYMMLYLGYLCLPLAYIAKTGITLCNDVSQVAQKLLVSKVTHTSFLFMIIYIYFPHM